jgi:hypothetical protein
MGENNNGACSTHDVHNSGNAHPIPGTVTNNSCKLRTAAKQHLNETACMTPCPGKSNRITRYVCASELEYTLDRFLDVVAPVHEQLQDEEGERIQASHDAGPPNTTIVPCASFSAPSTSNNA